MENVEALGGKHLCRQPVCPAEEEEEEPSCGIPQPATTTNVAREEGIGPPHARAVDDTIKICSADKEYQSAK